MAETVGFEPTRRSPAYTLSRRAPSTTRPRLLNNDVIELYWNYKRYKLKQVLISEMNIYTPILFTFFFNLTKAH